MLASTFGFMTAHNLPDVTVVADAGMASDANQGAIEDAGLSFILGAPLRRPRPFQNLEALQAALDAWREEYNTDRPHQSLDVAFPASRFGPSTSTLELRIPGQQGLIAPSESQAAEAGVAAARQAEPPRIALEADRLLPPSGNLWIGGQQIWLGPALVSLV